jgi:processing peptidase subunit alpha
MFFAELPPPQIFSFTTMMTMLYHVIARRVVLRQQRRWFSQKFSSYEYPLATEAPVVTKTTAEEAQKSASAHPWGKASPDPVDPFDDAGNLSDLQVDSIRSMQKKYLVTNLRGSTKISLEVPSSVPPNVPASALEVPHTDITTLDNGLRVVSQETYGQVCSIGILGNFGSRHERELGTAHLLELMAFQSTRHHKDSFEIQQKLQDWGATSFANAGREQTLWCLDILRPNAEKGMDLLKQVVLEPLLQDWEIDDAKRAMEYQAMDVMPQVQLGEAMQLAAYGSDQQLGKTHFGKPRDVHFLSKQFCAVSCLIHHLLCI